MKLFELFAEIALDTNKFDKGVKQTTQQGSGLAKSISGSLQTVSSRTIAMGHALYDFGKTAVRTLGNFAKDVIGEYANTEQLIGGVETLFGSSAQSVIDNAQQAYRTAGMSANQYMETVTAFSASLLKSLDGDTRAAAKAADVAVQDMADNANKMGTDISMIQNAYHGFAKQNYTMLDNLKLGYGGTRTEMQRLLKDAQAIQRAQGKNVKYSINNLDDVYEAIHVIQTEMGITGTTAAEASETILGSFYATKAAWSNLMAGLGTDQEMDQLVDNLLESGENLVRNIMDLVPRIGKRAVQAADKFLQNFDFYKTLKHAFDQGGWDGVASAAIGMLKTAFTNFWDNDMPTLATNAVNGIISGINTLFGTNIPKITSLQLPKWSDIKNVVTNWWSGLRGSIESACDWVLGIFDDPVETADQTKTAISDWWAGTAKPAIESACTWVLQMFDNPTEDQAAVTSKISAWWSDVSGGIASVVTFVASLVGVKDGTAEGIETATATWFQTIGEGLSKVCKFAATLGTPDEEDTEKAKQELAAWFEEEFKPATADVLKIGVKVGFELAESTSAAFLNFVEDNIQSILEGMGLGWLFTETEAKGEIREHVITQVEEAQSWSDPRQFAGMFSWMSEDMAYELSDYADLVLRAGGQGNLSESEIASEWADFEAVGGTADVWNQFREVLSAMTDSLLEGSEDGKPSDDAYAVIESWFESESGALDDLASAANAMSEAAQEAAGAAAALSGSIGNMKVEMDGQTVGQIVAPSVSEHIVRQYRRADFVTA